MATLKYSAVPREITIATLKKHFTTFSATCKVYEGTSKDPKTRPISISFAHEDLAKKALKKSAKMTFGPSNLSLHAPQQPALQTTTTQTTTTTAPAAPTVQTPVGWTVSFYDWQKLYCDQMMDLEEKARLHHVTIQWKNTALLIFGQDNAKRTFKNFALAARNKLQYVDINPDHLTPEVYQWAKQNNLLVATFQNYGTCIIGEDVRSKLNQQQ